MSQTTKFYLPFFTTGYPNGKLYTYISGTNTPALTYQDTTGTTHDNPIILDNKGNCILYVDQDVAYRYVLYDKDNNLIWDKNNIKQLKGDPGNPGGPKGAQGDQGIQGVQGISGGQGPVGFTGSIGDKGLPYLTKIPVSGNQTITIPAGINSVYISASGGGGAGASWSPYIYLYKTVDNTLASYTINAPYKLMSDGTTHYAQNSATYPRYNFSSLIMIPGSGMSGQSVYRQKITLDPSKENTIQIFIGAGGVPDSATLNGLDGSDTNIYLNNALILTLKGGIGGKNFFPKDSSSIPLVPLDGTPIRLNQGFKNGLLYFKQSGSDSLQTPAQGQSLNIWTANYKQKSGSFFVNAQVNLSYYCPLQSIAINQVAYYGYTTSNIVDVAGERNVFGNYYTYLQSRMDWTNAPDSSLIKTAIKTGANKRGWGAGGDVFYNENGNQAFLNGYFLQGTIPSGSSPSNVTIFDSDFIKSRILDYMINFNPSDAYSTGVDVIPSMTDTSGVWAGVDGVKSLIQSNPSSYLQFTGSGFYNAPGIRQPLASQNPLAVGGSGVSGFALIEYGNINEHGANEIVATQ